MFRYIIFAIVVVLAGCGGGGSPGTDPLPPPVTVQSAPPSCSASNDDTAALQALINAGGTVTLQARRYCLSATLIVSVSGTVLEGSGAATVLEFTPPAQGTGVACKTAGAIEVMCGPAASAPEAITAPVNIGDTSIEVADATGLNVGDWLLIGDWGVLGTYTSVVDWVQVASIDGTTLGLSSPARVAINDAGPFVPYQSGMGYVRTVDVSGVVLQDFSIKVDNNGSADNYPSLYVNGTRGTLVQRVTVDNPMGNPIDAYFSQGTKFRDVTVTDGRIISEMASDVDLTIENCTFSSEAPAIGLDLGTAFFTITGNTVLKSINAGIYALYNVHDGTISNNMVDYVDITAGQNASGLLLVGDHNLTISGNTLLGGAGSSVGVLVENSNVTGYVSSSSGITVTGNTIQGFASAISLP